MRAVTAVGMLVAALALILAIVALARMPEGAEEVRPEMAALRKELGGVSSKLGELDARLEELSTRTRRLQLPLAKARAPAVEVDPDKVREILRDEMRVQFERLRGGMRGRGGRDVSADALRGRVGLDEEKAGSVAQIREKLSKDTRAVWRENPGGNREENVKRMRELQKKAEEEIANLLTPEEMKKYREYTSRRGRGRRGRDRRGREEGRREGEEAGGGDVF